MLASGKVDRGRLPIPDAAARCRRRRWRRTDVSSRGSIAAIWAKQLRVERVGPDQDFFTDLGGHSLLAAQLVTALRKELGYNVPVRDIYAHRTVRSLAVRIAESAVP